jgi:signal transduction histidine kinase
MFSPVLLLERTRDFLSVWLPQLIDRVAAMVANRHCDVVGLAAASRLRQWTQEGGPGYAQRAGENASPARCPWSDGSLRLTEMRDPAALVERASRVLSWQRTLSMRRDLALPLVLLAVQLTGAALVGRNFNAFGPQRPLGAADWLLLVVGPVALVARRRHPVPALLVCFAVVLAPSGTGFARLSFFPVAVFVAVTAGKRYQAWLALVIAFVWAIWLAPLAYGYAAARPNDVLAAAGWMVALLIAAEATRIHAERAAATRTGRQLNQRRQQSEERLRVARDLHDVIGHNISLINVQASMGLDLMDSQPEQARAALSAIKSASKEALDELRAMLTTLRRDDDNAPRSPAPGLDRLPELIELTRAAGLNVEVELTGEAPPLPAAVQLATYRIIQESLTNVVRHAGPARVKVRVSYDEADMRIEIDDDGTTPTNGDATIGTGSGITGMRERATALGGELSAGFRSGGGFRVAARLPVRSPS